MLMTKANREEAVQVDGRPGVLVLGWGRLGPVVGARPGA